MKTRDRRARGRRGHKNRRSFPPRSRREGPGGEGPRIGHAVHGIAGAWRGESHSPLSESARRGEFPGISAAGGQSTGAYAIRPGAESGFSEDFGLIRNNPRSFPAFRPRPPSVPAAPPAPGTAPGPGRSSGVRRIPWASRDRRSLPCEPFSVPGIAIGTRSGDFRSRMALGTPPLSGNRSPIRLDSKTFPAAVSLFREKRERFGGVGGNPARSTGSPGSFDVFFDTFRRDLEYRISCISSRRESTVW